MWGDPEEALKLDAAEPLSLLLFQVASPAHIPHDDPRWQELLHGSGLWVHVEVRDDPEGVLHQACESMAKHAANSSNLATFCRLVAQMLDELNPKTEDDKQPDQVAEFSERIALVGKARTAAGSLQLLRIFVHRCLVQYGHQAQVLAEIFTYRNRDSGHVDPHVGLDLIDSLFRFLTAEKARTKIMQVPEVYDTAVLAFQLLLVMLSTQLYQPMLSSFQQQMQPPQSETTTAKQTDFFLDLIMEEARDRSSQKNNEPTKTNDKKRATTNGSRKGRKRKSGWTPQSVVRSCLDWQLQRLKSPDRSIAKYHYTLAKSVVAAKGEKVGPDGMYESNLVVSAACTSNNKSHRSSISDKFGESSSSLTAVGDAHPPSFLLDATRGVLVQASTIILLPFRLVSLALGLFHSHQNGFERSRKSHFARGSNSRTRDILWITESPLADLASCLFLLLTNNRRYAGGAAAAPQQANSEDDNNAQIPEGNPFRMELMALTDNRWESSGHDVSALPDLPDPLLHESISLVESFEKEGERRRESSQSIVSHHPGNNKDHLMMNFETLFESFGAILHTEVGALAMYTILRSSQTFSETLAVRSDLDTLVLPLLRTLYFASTSRHVSALDFQAKSKASSSEKALAAHENDKAKLASNTLSASIRTMPFRSPSQLYVIVILLLLFSQDSSFGSDAFRRTMVPSVPWYKERYLKDVSLGSVLLLTLLRALTFNLNRLHDMFLLGNCCAVMMNLSNSIMDLHDYAAMRLASVTVSCLKKYTAMSLEHDKKGKNGGAEDDDEGDSLLDMYAEVSHTLLRLIKDTLVQKNIERNLGVVYALVYHQADFKKIFSMKHTPFKKSEISRIHNVIKTSSKIIESKSNARTATKALQVLTENIDEIKEAVAEKKKKKDVEKEDFTYTYEEEADPETFFVPYIWEVVVCAVTASSVEWNRNKIQVFPLLEVEEVPIDVAEGANDSGEDGAPAAFAADIMDVV